MNVFIYVCVHAHAHIQVHWFSILNSFMIVLFLSGLIAMILLRTLKADFERCTTKPEIINPHHDAKPVKPNPSQGVDYIVI